MFYITAYMINIVKFVLYGIRPQRNPFGLNFGYFDKGSLSITDFLGKIFDKIK